jgi:hypothetical protein
MYLRRSTIHATIQAKLRTVNPTLVCHRKSYQKGAVLVEENKRLNRWTQKSQTRRGNKVTDGVRTHHGKRIDTIERGGERGRDRVSGHAHKERSFTTTLHRCHLQGVAISSVQLTKNPPQLQFKTATGAHTLLLKDMDTSTR